MKVDEVKELVKASGKSVVNVRITSHKGFQAKQSLRIDAHDTLCIGGYKSKFPNYKIGENLTEKWAKIEIIK